MELSTLLSIKQAAEITGLSHLSIRYHLKKEHLKGTRFSDVWIIENKDLITFITDRNNGKFCKSGRPKKSSADLFETVIPG